MASDMIRIKTFISVNYITGSTREDVIEFPREEWEAMTEDEQQEQLDGITETILTNSVEVSAYVDEDED